MAVDFMPCDPITWKSLKNRLRSKILMVKPRQFKPCLKLFLSLFLSILTLNWSLEVTWGRLRSLKVPWGHMRLPWANSESILNRPFHIIFSFTMPRYHHHDALTIFYEKIFWPKITIFRKNVFPFLFSKLRREFTLLTVLESSNI